MLQVRDLPLETCLAVGRDTSLSQVARLATGANARYVLVREASGDTLGVQLSSVARWMAQSTPSASAGSLPVVEGLDVEPGTSVLEALTWLATSRASVLVVRESSLGTCRVVPRTVVQMTASVHATRDARATWAS